MWPSSPHGGGTIIAPGFSNDADKFDLTVRLAVIMFPYLMSMSLTAMMSGILNSLHRYFVAAIAPVFLNIILVAVLAHALLNGLGGLATGYNMAWGVLASGIVQLLLVMVAVRKAGIVIGLRAPRITPKVRRLLWLALPAAVTGGITLQVPSPVSEWAYSLLADDSDPDDDDDISP